MVGCCDLARRGQGVWHEEAGTATHVVQHPLVLSVAYSVKYGLADNAQKFVTVREDCNLWDSANRGKSCIPDDGAYLIFQGLLSPIHPSKVCSVNSLGVAPFRWSVFNSQIPLEIGCSNASLFAFDNVQTCRCKPAWSLRTNGSTSGVT